MSTVSISQAHHVASIMLKGEFDVANVDELQANAQQALARASVTHIVVDLEQVTFMDATALGALIGLREDAARGSLSLALSNVPARVRRLLEITELDTLFDIASDAAFDVDVRRSTDEALGR